MYKRELRECEMDLGEDQATWWSQREPTGLLLSHPTEHTYTLSPEKALLY